MLYPLHWDNWPSHWLYWLLFTCLYFASTVTRASAGDPQLSHKPILIATETHNPVTQHFPPNMNQHGSPLTVTEQKREEREHLFFMTMTSDGPCTGRNLLLVKKVHAFSCKLVMVITILVLTILTLVVPFSQLMISTLLSYSSLP